jgi:hypothetical protein
MANYTGADSRGNFCSQYVTVAAGVTTKQISVAATSISNPNERGDFLAGVLVTWASTATGVVTVYDGTTALAAIPSPVTGALDITPRYVEFGCVAQTTKGFNITCGSSVSCVAFGRFS